MASRYHEVYDSWKRDPQAFWAAAAEDIDWFKRWDKVFDPDQGVYGRWFTGAMCNTAYNCLDRHIERGRGDQVALIHDSAITRQDPALHLSRAARRGGGARRACCATTASARATASSSTCRWSPRPRSPCSPAPASAPCIRWCSAASPRRSLRPASTTRRPKMVISASCGLEPGRVVAYKPLLDQAIALAKIRRTNA